MATIESANKVTYPGGATAATTVDLSGLSGGTGGSVALGSLMKPMDTPYPAVDATNGPMTADTGIVLGTPSTTGRAFYAWNSGVFRTQGMNWIAGNAAVNTGGWSACINASTARVWSYGTTQGSYMESNHDFAFVSDSTSVTIFYFNWNGYTGGNYHDMRIFVEDGGQMKTVRDAAGTIMPKTTTAGAGLTYVTLTFKEARSRQIRVMLPSRMYFIGVYVDTQAMIRKAANEFLLACNGDSWQEPNGNNMANNNGGAYPTGMYHTMGLSQELAVATGWSTVLIAQGGTGYFNANDGQSHTGSYTGAAVESVFLGNSRMTDFITKFGAQYPVLMTLGGWNDGSLNPSGTGARVQEGLSYLKNLKGDIRYFAVGIQPVGDALTLDSDRVTANNQLRTTYTSATNVANSMGFIDMVPMWPRVDMTGQRGANVNSSDKIHIHSKGAQGVSRWVRAAIGSLTVPQTYLNQMLSA